MWARLEEAQRTHSVEKTSQRSRYAKQANVGIADPAIHPKDVQHMAKDAVSVPR